MSVPDYDIVHSPEAEAFLRMVTQGFYNRSYIGLWIYEVIGREWDELREWSEGMRSEINPQTCTWSIAIWEWVYGFEPDESMTLEERRIRVLSRVFSARPINPEVMRRRIAELSGAETELQDLVAPYTFEVTMTATNGPIPCDAVFRYIARAKPAHLAVRVTIVIPGLETNIHISGETETHTNIGVAEGGTDYAFTDTIYTGDGTAIHGGNHTAEDAVVYRMRTDIHATGEAALHPATQVPTQDDTRSIQAELRPRGETVTISHRPSVTGTDNLETRSTIPTGSRPATHGSTDTQEDTATPSNISILRTGGVVTIHIQGE